MARVFCHHGYTLHGPELLACVDKQWNGTQPECLGNVRYVKLAQSPTLIDNIGNG